MKTARRILTRLRAQTSEDHVPLLTRDEIKALLNEAEPVPDPPSRKNQFLIMVFSGALMRDIQNNRTDAQAVARFAMEIEEQKIPPNINAAAASLLNFFYTNKGCPHKWMLVGLEQEFARL